MSYACRRAALLAALLVPEVASAQGVQNPAIFDALALAPGATVCEIGAGDGALSIEVADRVGAQGHVYTSELGAERLKALRSKVAAAHKPQIHVIEGAAERTNFPDGACDALFMRNVYHHFETPSAMNRSIAAALKPGGRVAIVDFGPPDKEAPKPADRDQDGMHGVTPAAVHRELTDAGFQNVATAVTPKGGPDRWYMVVALKPGS
jgi:ubiquinone/menaquinone biosynthesis C-methylase UbiE